MASIETRLAQLESAPTKTDHSRYTDAERAVRLAWVIEKGGPTADRLLAILGNADKRIDDHGHA